MRLLFLLFFLVSCNDPMKTARPVAKELARKNPSLLTTYQGKNRRMRVAAAGAETGKVVLFIHGSPGSWEAWAEYLSDPVLTQEYRLYAVDRPGYGGSGRGVAETSLTHQAQDALASLPPESSAIIVGHSYGAPVAVKLAALHPERVGGLVLVAGALDPALEETKWYQYPARWWPIRYVVPAELDVCNIEIMALKEELALLDTEYEKVSAPVWIIHGDQDDLVPKENVDYLKRKFGSRVVHVDLVEGLNHFVPWKRPDLIKQAIRKIHKLTEDNGDGNSK